MLRSWWSEFLFSACEFKKALERDWMLRRYYKWSHGQVPVEDRILDGMERIKLEIITSWRLMVKRLLDISVSTLGLIVFSPVMAVTAIAIKLDSPGPVIFRQSRVGMKGRQFFMYKFRTMHEDAEAATGPVWASQNDPRVTRVGNLLRKTHLDELPQLWNVLEGTMSVVGPRPERPYFVNELRKWIPHYDRRLCAKPGITGLAQIKRRYDETIADVRKKVRYDILYIQKMCPLLDMKVIALTVLAVLGRTGR
ncbi:MAG: sugar transferase [Candidatus Omnitrophica bacterium]|nr:sugar transferase [Candidatus Omnitrophota bacterium]